jgi:arsenate reductase (glutaredoxin)
MLKIYGIPNCNTVKKALDFLRIKNVTYVFHNYKKEGISIDKLEEWLQQVPLESLINKNGNTYKALSEEEKSAFDNPHTAIPIIINKPSIIRRPIAEDYKIIAMGYNETNYEMVFANK